MANLKQAMIWLAEGKKISQPSWGAARYYSIHKGHLQDETGLDCQQLDESNDWEIYIEPKADEVISISEFQNYLKHFEFKLNTLHKRITALERK